MVYIIVGSVFAILFFILLIFLKKTKKGRQGSRGEWYVSEVLGDTIPGKRYVINNFLVNLSENKSMQIDHILINSKGIFVIETKNFSGVIYGNENSIKWKQYIKSRNRGGYAYKTTENEFYNPIKQNRTHIYHLSKIIGRTDCFKNIVVFTNRAESIKCSVAQNASVLRISDLRRTLESFHQDILSTTDMEKIFTTLQNYQKNNPISDREHKSYVQETKKIF